MQAKQKIGILGGTFQPVHVAHLQMAQSALERLGLDAVLLIPTNIPPHKSIADGASTEDRWNMLCLAVKDTLPPALRATPLPEKGRLIPDDMELRREGPSYTVDTLRLLREKYPLADLFFLMGSDMLAGFDSWREPEAVAALATLVCIPRDGADDSSAIAHIRARYGAKILLLPPAFPISSTQIRERVAAALPVTGLVPPAAEKYLYHHGLYQPEFIRDAMAKLSAALPARRFAHSIATMSTAIALAERYGVNAEQARLAALLHDCAKALPLPEQQRLSGDDTHIPPTWHAGASAALAESEYGVTDKQVLRAIRLHTTGDAGMTALDKIIYLADLIEPNRKFPFVEEIRKIAGQARNDEEKTLCGRIATQIRRETDLDSAILLALYHNICYIQSVGGQLHPASVRAYHDLGGIT